MPSDNSVFRKVALDRLSSPDQLDRLMEVTSSKGWLALGAAGGVLLVALLWSILGSIPTRIAGQGILIKGGTVLDVVAAGGGVVTQLLCKAGSEISTNDLIAVISQPELELKIHNTQLLLDDLVAQDRRLREQERDSLGIDRSSLEQEHTNLLFSITNYHRQSEALAKKLSNQQQALAKGLIIESDLLATQIEIFRTRQQEAAAEQRLLQIQALRIDRPMQVQQSQSARQQHIAETSRSLELLRKQLELNSLVRSPYSGTVLEIVVDRGNFIGPGTRLLSLETHDQLRAVVFAAAGDGKRIKHQMEAQISPATVKTEEYGFIRGTVTFVSSFPSTPERMMRVLRNQELVRQLSGAGAPIEVLVNLDRRSNGSYNWSSAARDPVEITSGTLCSGSIIVKRSRPISLVLPLLRETSGL